MRDIFEEKRISPMLLTESAPFEADGWIYELKFDGARGVAYLDKDRTYLRNKRNKNIDLIYPELNNLHQYSAGKRIILDGELVVFKNGESDFFSLQRRSLTSNSLKVALGMRRSPVTFVAFDILYCERDLTSEPISVRKEILYSEVREGTGLTISRHINSGGLKLYESVKARKLEGVVAKKADSLYHLGIRTKNWLKFKAMLDEELIIAGYVPDGERIVSVLLASYNKNSSLVYRGSVTAYETSDAARLIKSLPPGVPLSERAGAVWVAPLICCTVKFMDYTETFGLRQPIYKGLALETPPQSCVYPPRQN